MKNLVFSIVISVLVSTQLQAGGTPSTLYGVTGDGGTPSETLFELSKTDASSTLVTSLGSGNDGEEIAFNRDDGLLYHASGTTDTGPGPIFETIDLDTLATSSITLSGFAFTEIAGLTYAGSGVFTASDRISANGLHTITTGGVVNNLGPTFPNTHTGVAYIGSTLYAVTRSDDLLRILDPSDGSTLSSVTMTLAGFTISGATGLATNPDDNVLWALLKVDGGLPGNRALATVDAATGTATLIGITDVPGMAGIAFAYTPCATCEVTPSVVSGTGTISPSTPQNVTYGNTTAFTLTPGVGYLIDFVDGTCGGSLAGATYTTSIIYNHCTVLAHFIIQTFTLDYFAGANGSISGDVSQIVDYGSNGTQVTAVPDTNYDFVDWSDGVLTASRTETNVMANLSVTANFELTTHTVTSSVGAPAGNITPLGEQEITHGQTTQFTLTPNANYLVESVSGTCGGELVGTTFTTDPILGDCTVIANFIIETRTVSSSVGTPAGDISPVGEQEIDFGSTTQFTLTPDTNYVIASVDGTCGGSLAGSVFTTDPVMADCTVIANFELETYTVTSSVGTPAGDISPLGGQEIQHGMTTIFTISPDSNYLIESVDGTCGGELVGTTYTTDPIFADCSVIANFEIETRTVSSSVGTGSGNISPSGDQEIDYGTTTQFTLTPDTNYVIASVGGDCGGSLVGNIFTTNSITANCSVIANFELDQYTVNSSVGTPAGTITPSGNQEITHGQTTQFTLTPDANYLIASVGGTCGGNLDGSTFTTDPILADCTVIANFELETRTVSSSVGTPAGTIDPLGDQEIDYGATTEFSLMPAANHVIASVGGTCPGSLDGNTFTTDPITTDCTVVANFEPETRTVTSSVGTPEGTISPVGDQEVDYGSTAQFTLTPGANNVVASVGGSCGGSLVGSIFTTNPITADCTVIANFELGTLTVTSSVGTPAGSITPQGEQDVQYGMTTAFTLTPDTNHVISSVGGTCGGDLVGATFTTEPITTDCTVVANFEIETHTVSSSVGTPAGMIDPVGDQEIQLGMATQFTLTPDANYLISSVGGTCGGSLVGTTYTTNPITADCTVIANFELETHTVTSSVGTPAGIIAPLGGQEVQHGMSTQFTLTPDANNMIASVGGSCGGSLAGNIFTTDPITADCTVVANFAIETFTLAYTAGAGGQILGDSPQVVEFGASGTPVTADPDSFYSFVDWSDGVLTATRTDTNVMADISVTANFAIDTYTVNSSVGTGPGTISPPGDQTIDHGDTPQFTITPDTGYEIESVEGTCGGNLVGNTFTTNPVIADCTVIANFVIQTFTLTYTAGAGGSVTGDSPQMVDYGMDGTEVSAIPDTNFLFVGWSDGVMTASRTDTNVMADITATANFSPEMNTVTSSVGTPSGTITPLGDQTIEYGETTQFMLAPDVDYMIASVGGTCGGSLAGNTFTTDPIVESCTVIANFGLVTYTVSSSVGSPAGTITPAGDQEIELGSTAQFMVTPDAGHSIDFVDGTCGGNLVGSTYTTDPITANCTVVANFVIDTFTLTYLAGANGSVSGDSPQMVDYGMDGAEVTAVPDADFVFIDWSDGVMTAARTDTNVMADITVTANFGPDMHTVTSSVGTPAGTISPLGEQEITHGQTTQFTLSPDTNYVIASVGGSCGGSLVGSTYTTDPILADCTVIANFELDQYTVTSSIGTPAGAISPLGGQEVTHGQTTQFTLTPDTNYVIASVGGSCGGNLDGNTFTTDPVTTECTVIANFELETHTVSSSVGTPAGSIAPMVDQEITHGQTTQFTVTPDAGHSIDSVGGTCGGNLVGNTYTTESIIADCSVVANFIIDTFTLEYLAGSNGSISGTTPQMVDYGMDGSEVTAIPDTNYDFADWSDGVLTEARTDTNVMADLSVTASFILTTHLVSSSVGTPAGTISPLGDQEITHGQTTQFTLTPDENHVIASVGGTCGGSLVGSTFTTDPILADCTVIANFELDQYTVTSSVGTPAGMISPVGDQEIVHGQTTQFTLTPDENHVIASVGGTCGGSLAGNTYTTDPITGDCTVIANFELDQYTVTSSVGSPAGAISPSGDQQVIHGQTTQFTLTPDENYVIASVGGTCGGSLDENTYTTDPITDECTVIANFELDQYKVTSSVGTAAGTISPLGNQQVIHGQTTQFTLTPDENYVIASVGGTCGGSLDENTYTTAPITRKCTVIANFELDQYTVTSSVGIPAGTISPVGDQEIVHGETTQFTLTPDTNHVIASVGGTCGGSLVGSTFTTDPILADCTVIANFELDQYTVTSSVGTPAGMISPVGDQEIVHGQTTQFTLTPDENHVIASVGGTCGGSLVGSTFTTDPILADCTVIANFELDQYTVTSSVGTPAGMISPVGDQEIVHGQTTQFTLTPDENHVIASVGGTCGGSLDNNTFTTDPVTGECTVIANFELDQYTVTSSVGTPAGMISPVGDQEIVHGQTTQFTLTPDANNVIESVGGTCGGNLEGSTYTTDPITADCSVMANFELEEYTVTSSVGTPAGTITPQGDQEIPHGSSPQFLLTGDTGYEVSAVGGTCGGSLEENTFTTNPVTAECTVVANFVIRTFTLTYTAGPGGSITGTTPQQLEFGQDGDEVTAVPDTNYNFVQWSDGVLTESRTDTNVMVDISVVANFAIETYTVTSSVGTGSGSISPSGGQQVDHGSTTEFTLTPGQGFIIGTVGGTCGGNLVGNTFTTNPITGVCTVIANFDSDPDVILIQGFE